MADIHKSVLSFGSMSLIVGGLALAGLLFWGWKTGQALPLWPALLVMGVNVFGAEISCTPKFRYLPSSWPFDASTSCFQPPDCASDRGVSIVGMAHPWISACHCTVLRLSRWYQRATHVAESQVLTHQRRGGLCQRDGRQKTQGLDPDRDDVRGQRAGLDRGPQIADQARE